VAGLSVVREFDRFSISVWTLDRFTLNADNYGYQASQQLLAGATGKTSFGVAKWTFSGGLDVYRETPERWDGAIEAEGNLGRTDFLLDVSAAWHFSPSWTLTFGAKVPVYSVVVGEQASYPAILTVGVASGLQPPRAGN
jgi:hypothetical protein